MTSASALKIKMRGWWKTTRGFRRVVENVGDVRISTVRHERAQKRQGCLNVRFFSLLRCSTNCAFHCNSRNYAEIVMFRGLK
jgi:hypothetical protein